MAPVQLPRQPVSGRGVRLRLYRRSDVDDLVAGCNDPLIQRFVPILPNPYTRADALWWIEQGSVAAWAAGTAAYAIVDPATDRLIGGAGLTLAPGSRAQAEIGYWVAPWARRRGVATAATVALSGWAFAQGVHRVQLLAAVENVASQRVAIAAGFRREGVLRALTPHPSGGWEDRVAWSRVAGDPAGPTPRLLPDLPGGALTDGVVRLRPLRPADAVAMHTLHALPDVVASSMPPIAPDREEIELRCARSGAWWLAGERADMVIEDAAGTAAAGEIGLYYTEPQTGQAMVGYSMLPAWRGRGYATRAVRLLARWAFEETGIARLVAGTDPANVGSQRVLRRAGFRQEGYQRERLPGPDGTRTDDVLFALLASDVPRTRDPRTHDRLRADGPRPGDAPWTGDWPPADDASQTNGVPRANGGPRASGAVRSAGRVEPGRGGPADGCGGPFPTAIRPG